MKKQKGNIFEEIPLPIMKVRKVGNSHVLTIPYGIIKKYDIGTNQKVFAVLFLRRHSLRNEQKDGKIWVNVDEETFKDYELYKKTMVRI